MNYVLQPCQTCGNMYPEIYHDTIRHYFQCRCENCHAQTETFKYEAQAIDAWNKGKVEAERQ